ncbi:hypothetical protein P3S68_026435 [Capsicum galapagoense]
MGFQMPLFKFGTQVVEVYLVSGERRILETFFLTWRVVSLKRRKEQGLLVALGSDNENVLAVDISTGFVRRRKDGALPRLQISISKRLIEKGIKCWNLISNNNHHVFWENLVSELEEHFLKMTFGRTRSLNSSDKFCHTYGRIETVARETFLPTIFHFYQLIAYGSTESLEFTLVDISSPGNDIIIAAGEQAEKEVATVQENGHVKKGGAHSQHR